MAVTVGMSLIHSLTSRISRYRQRFGNLRFDVRASSSSSISSDILEARREWIEYMVEFRGVQSVFRLNEFRDSYKQVMSGKDDEEVEFTSIIEDVLQPNIPICAYVLLPNESIAIAITKRCSLVRSISQVWGDAITMEEVRIKTEQNFPTLIAPIFNEKNSIESNSWRVDFRRYGRSGRSGLDPEGKKNVLQTFSTILKNMKGVVSLSDAKHNLLYLEDWSTYRSWTLEMDAAARVLSKAENKLEMKIDMEIEIEIEVGTEGECESERERKRVNETVITTSPILAAVSTGAARTAVSTDVRIVTSEKKVETYEENRIRRNAAIINRNNRNNTRNSIDGTDLTNIDNNASYSRMIVGINKKERRLNSEIENNKKNENREKNISKIKKGESNLFPMLSNNMKRKENSDYKPSSGEINHDDGTYVPLKCVLARVIAEGPCVVSDFDLKRRPYLGTNVCDGLSCVCYCTVVYYTILYYTVLYYTILYYTILYYTILYYTRLYYIMIYYIILYYTILDYTILYYTILYYTILDYAIL